MGLLDSLMGSIKGGGKKTDNQMVDIVTQMLGNPEIGGIQGLVKSFQEGGLGEQVMSWISKGKNLPISADQIMKVLSRDRITDIAKKLNISEKSAAAKLKSILPDVIDRLTPDGDVPDGDMLSKGIDMLKGGLFRK